MQAIKTAGWFFLALAPLVGQDWPQFRGPHGNGVSELREVPTVWSSEENVRWKVPLHRPANGSPVVSKDRVFLTLTQDEDGKQRSLCCFDRADGALLWTRTVTHGEAMPTHRTNPYGGSTPAADGERVRDKLPKLDRWRDPRSRR